MSSLQFMKGWRLWMGLILLCPLTQAGAVPANLNTATSEMDFLGDVPVVLTATRLRQPVTEAPVSMTVIERDMIRASGFRELADLLRLVPGFQVSQANGNTFVPAYHGLADTWPRRLQVQVDGRSVYLPMLSTVDWSYLGIVLEDIERIEVIRGSNAPVYGSNAFLGVVNIITRQPFQDRGWFVQGTVGSLYAGRLQDGLKAKDADQAGKALDSREAVLRYASDFAGWDYRASLNYREDNGFAQVDDSKQVSSIAFRAVNSLSTSDRLDIQLGYSGGPSGTGVVNGDTEIIHQQRDKRTQSNYQSINWARALSPTDELSLRFYHNGYQLNDNYSLGGIGEVMSDVTGVPAAFIDVATIFPGREGQDFYYGEYDGQADRFDLELQSVSQPWAGIRFIWGVSVRMDRLKSRWMLGREDAVNDFSQRMFVNGQWSASTNWLISAGTMLERNQIIGVYQSPRLAVNYQVSRNQSLRLSATRSVRSPSLFEDNANFAVQFENGDLATVLRTHDENLEGEQLTSFEFGYINNITRWHLELDAKLFIERLRGAIFDATDNGFQQPIVTADGNPLEYPNDEPFIYVNGIDSDTTGIELQLSFVPSKRTLIRANYSYVDSRVQQLREINLPVDSTKEAYRSLDTGRSKIIPSHTLSVLASQAFSGGLELSGSFYRITEMTWLGDGSALPSYNRLDLRVGQKFRVDGSRVSVALVAQNLLEDYNEFSFNNVFAQRFYLQAGIEF